MDFRKALSKGFDDVASKRLHSSKVVVYCEFCGEDFSVAYSVSIDPKKGRFCSKECYDNYRRTVKAI